MKHNEAKAELIISITPSNNAWNKAAVCMARECNKVPSQRKPAGCSAGLDIKRTTIKSSVKMTTNEWNNLALKTIQTTNN